MRKANYLLGSRAHVMRTRRLYERLAYVMRAESRARVTCAAATPTGARQHAATIVDNAKALG